MLECISEVEIGGTKWNQIIDELKRMVGILDDPKFAENLAQVVNSKYISIITYYSKYLR